jgi:hypothetical protein
LNRLVVKRRPTERRAQAMQRIVTKIAFSRLGVRAFERLVNRQLADGWTAKSVSVDKRGLRFVYVALLERT